MTQPEKTNDSQKSAEKEVSDQGDNKSVVMKEGKKYYL